MTGWRAAPEEVGAWNFAVFDGSDLKTDGATLTMQHRPCRRQWEFTTDRDELSCNPWRAVKFHIDAHEEDCMVSRIVETTKARK